MCVGDDDKIKIRLWIKLPNKQAVSGISSFYLLLFLFLLLFSFYNFSFLYRFLTFRLLFFLILDSQKEQERIIISKQLTKL